MADESFTDFESLFRDNVAHSNPMFDFLTGFMPRRLRDLFIWMEYLYYNSAQIFAALKKFSEYPITEISYKTDNEQLKEKTKTLLEKTLKIKDTLVLAGRDRWIYGNAFLSLYQPFARFLECPNCKKMVNIKHVNYRFRYQKMSFQYACGKCKRKVNGRIVDRKLTNPDMIHIIRWDPKQMDIDYNFYTGESDYYYSIPPDVKDKIRKGNKLLLNSIPVEFIKASRDNKLFKFKPGQIYHMKVAPPAGINQQWGFPPLTSSLKLFFYTAVLRKANEATALDHLNTFRIVSPRQNSSNADPIQTISLAKMFGEFRENLKKWRRDPLGIMTSPIPIETSQVGGDGRALLTLGEVKDAEDNIILSMGIPLEFLRGGLSFTGSAITLRMLENQLITYTSELNELMQWVTNKSCNMLGWEKSDVELVPFKLIDDVQQKQVMMSLNQNSATGPMVSNTTIAEHNDIDLIEERKRLKQEYLDNIRFNQELQVEGRKLQESLASKVQTQSAQGQGMNYDQQAVIGYADQLVQELMQYDEGTRKSRLHSLQVEDFVLYSVVIQRLEEMQTMQTQQAKAQTQGS